MNPFPPALVIDLASPTDGQLRVQVRGELDLSTSPELGEVLQRAIHEGKSVVLDLSEITFIDSTGLNALIRALSACEANGGALAVRPNLPAQVARVFEITGLDAVLPITSE